MHNTLQFNRRQLLIAKRIRPDILLVKLDKEKQKCPIQLYGIRQLVNHIHLLIKPDDTSQLPKLMHWVKTTSGSSMPCATFTLIHKQQECAMVSITLISTMGTTADWK